MATRKWAVSMSAVALAAMVGLTACGGDDGAGVRTIDDGGSASGSASGSVSGSASGSVTEPASK